MASQRYNVVFIKLKLLNFHSTWSAWHVRCWRY